MTTETVKLCECGCGQPTAIIKKTDSRYGYVKGQPHKFLKDHINRFCPNGHDTFKGGRHKYGHCKQCIKEKNKIYRNSTHGYITRRKYDLRKSKELNLIKLQELINVR